MGADVLRRQEHKFDAAIRDAWVVKCRAVPALVTPFVIFEKGIVFVLGIIMVAKALVISVALVIGSI